MNLALGFFDGVHLGHQAVIRAAVERGPATVVTFKDHPFCYLYNLTPKYILSRQQRREHIEALGANVVELDFAAMSKMSAAQYLDFLRKGFSPSAIFTGYNHTFGADKAGTSQFLRANFENYFEVAPVELNGEIISSTKIRKALTGGDVGIANAMLGYNFSVSGTVIEGQKLGRELGFPTVNLAYPQDLIELPYGVYAAKVGSKKAVANFGVRPTVENAGQKLLEVHILDFKDDIYGQPITIEFLSMLRSEQKFGSLEALKNQITLDIKSLM